MAAKINVPGAGERAGYSKIDYYATRISIAVRTRWGSKAKAPASVGDGVKLIAERTQSYNDGSLSSKEKAKVVGKILVGSAVVTVAGMAGLDQLAPIGSGVSSLYDAVLAGIWAIPRLGALLGVGGNVAYFGHKGVKQTARFSDIVDAVMETGKLVDDERLKPEYLEGCAAALSILSPADQMLLTDIISKRSSALAAELRTKLGMPAPEAPGKAVKPAALPKPADIVQRVKLLEEGIKARDERIAVLQAENVKLAQLGSEKLEGLKKVLEAQLGGKQSQIDDLVKRLNSLTQEGSQTAAQVAQMSSEKDGLIKVNTALTQKVGELTAKIAEQEKALQSMYQQFDKKGKEEIARVNGELKAVEARLTAEITRRDSEIAQLQAEKDQIAAQAASLTRDKDKEIGTLKGQLFNASQSADISTEEAKVLRSEVVELKTEKQKMMFQIQEFYAKRTDADVKTADNLTQLQGKIDAFAEEAVKKDKVISDLRAEKTRLTEETAQMAAQLKEKMDALARTAKEEIAKRDEQIRKLSENINKEAGDKIRQLEAEKEELTARIREVEASYKAKVSALQAQISASETFVQPVSLQSDAVASIAGVEEFDKILAQLNKLNDSLEELKGPGQPTMGLAGVQRQLSYVIQVLVSMFTRMRGKYLEHQGMLAELKKYKELLSKVVPSVEQAHSDLQDFSKGK